MSDDDTGYMSSDNEDFEYYYESDPDVINTINKPDPEDFPVKCLAVYEAEKMLNELVEQLCININVTPPISKVLLHENKWAINEVLTKYKEDPDELFVTSRMKVLHPVSIETKKDFVCPVCLKPTAEELGITSLTCGHRFCDKCWRSYFEKKIERGISTEISCMALNCELLVTEEIILSIVNEPNLIERYRQFAFREYIKAHPLITFCPEADCNAVIISKESLAKRAVCTKCDSSFCFECGNNYHAPIDCITFKKWIIKCKDDSETANYITANTKACPSCNNSIEKNGGCNHMICVSCKFAFCWMCLGDWKGHDNYSCSKYKEDPENDSKSDGARNALKKYLHYYERWDIHSNSLQLEKQTLNKITERIQNEIDKNNGTTWIDWQYLLDAANLLAKCRYTLKYSYPYAYYLEDGPHKELFEYQQAELEVEVENLSYKIERAESYDRVDIENHMSIVEKRAISLRTTFN